MSPMLKDPEDLAVELRSLVGTIGPMAVHADPETLRRALLEAATQLERYAEKPLHCPCCDGDHL